MQLMPVAGGSVGSAVPEPPNALARQLIELTQRRLVGRQAMLRSG